MDILQFQIFILIFTRISSFFVSSPFFSMKGLPTMLKIGFSFAIALIIYVMTPEMNIDFNTPFIFYFLIIKEALVGLALGYITNLVYISIQMAGQLADIQLGFSMASLYDPLTQSRVSLYGRMYNWIGLVLFFSINGHYYLLYAIIQSFSFIPVGLTKLQGINIGEIAVVFSKSFLIAFQIGIPLILVGFMTDIIMGFIARTIPQLNVFILGMPLKVLVGLIAFVILLPEVSNLIISVFEDIPSTLEKMMR